MRQLILILFLIFAEYSSAQDSIAQINKNGRQTYFTNHLRTPTLEESLVTTDKSFFIGARFALGTGAVQSDILGWFDLSLSTNFGADVGYYFNDIIGVKTGISYLSLPYGNHKEKSFSLLGIPATMVVSVGERVGFYSEIGAVFYFQSGNNNPIIAADNMIGFHITSDNVDFKLGPVLNFTIKGKLNEYNAGSIFFGINAALSIFL